jgi:hypothetical protein
MGSRIGSIWGADVIWDPADLDKVTLCKLCHSKEKQGNQWGVWEKGPHARAYEMLGSAQAKAVAAKLGIDDPQNSGKCLKCHSTAYGFTEAQVSDKVDVKLGITCQTCHGPAKRYKMVHQKNRKKAYAEAGLIKPTEANTCNRCHNSDSPTYDTQRYTKADGSKTAFDYPQAYEKIKHPKKTE